MSNSSKTDWTRVDAQTDETINTSDIPPLGESFFAKAQLRPPQKPVSVTLQVDPNVLAWFRSTGTDWEQRAGAALRLYAAAHQADSSTPVVD
jgi:uncharacterized protein (DUF4415 family)